MGMMINGMQPQTKSYAVTHRDSLQTTAAKKTNTKKKSSQKKTKKLTYNFKEVSGQILRAKTSFTAGKAVIKARGKVANLRQKLFTGEYDDEDLRHAIIHAEKMLRVAKKRQKHLKQEENAKQNMADTKLEEALTEGSLETQDELGEQAVAEGMQEISEMSREEMKKQMEKLLQQLQEMMQEQMEDDELTELADDMTQMSYADMDAQDLEQLKKKHRQEEMREIILADMKYLKAVFDKLAREKQEAQNSTFSNVSLEIGEMDMSVQMMDAPILSEGACIDESV